MAHLSAAATDDELIQFVDGWAALLEQENYAAAFAYTAHVPEMRWTPDLIREVIKSYHECKPGQKVTLRGVPSDVRQRKDVNRRPRNREGGIGYVWYDLNIDGVASDLTATFDIIEIVDGVEVRLNDIHVM